MAKKTHAKPPEPPDDVPVSWWQKLLTWEEYLIVTHPKATTAAADDMPEPSAFGINETSTLRSVPWPDVIGWMRAELALAGSEVIPMIHRWIVDLPTGVNVKAAMSMFVVLLGSHLPPAPPVG
jgi:hypothetical protein